jgi:4-hydroxy-2-oxoheptanedioate aldolase
MRRNRAKQKLEAGGVAVGITVNFAHPGLAEYLGLLGYDCLIVDGEHGAVMDDQVEDLARVADITGAASMVRLPLNGPLIQRYLGMGISGLQIPQMQSADEVRELIREAKFPPLGQRGLGNMRAGKYGLAEGGFQGMMEEANRETFLVIQIEDRQGIAALPEILRMPEIDVILVGHTDLSSDLGHPGEVNHPEVVKAVDEIVRLTNAAGKAAGLPASTPEEARAMRKRGARYILSSSTRALSIGSRGLLEEIRQMHEAETSAIGTAQRFEH